MLSFDPRDKPPQVLDLQFLLDNQILTEMFGGTSLRLLLKSLQSHNSTFSDKKLNNTISSSHIRQTGEEDEILSDILKSTDWLQILLSADHSML